MGHSESLANEEIRREQGIARIAGHACRPDIQGPRHFFRPEKMIGTGEDRGVSVGLVPKGTDEVMTMSGITNSFFSQVVTGVMFLMIIGCEFFINYRVVFRHRAKETPAAAPVLAEETTGTIESSDTSLTEENSATSSTEEIPADDAAKEDNV